MVQSSGWYKGLLALLVMAALAAFVPLGAGRALGQAEDPEEADAPAQEDPPPPIRKKRKLDPDALARKRIAEFLARGEDAGKPATSRTLVGPPLNDREKVYHALNRLGFGPRPGEVDQILEEGGWEKWAEGQLDPRAVDDEELEKDVEQRFPFTKLKLQELREEYPLKDDRQEYLERALPELVMYRAVKSERRFQEVMCEFWRNHFFVNQPGQAAPTRSWTTVDYEQNVIRKHAFGKFKDMLFASARHPAMLEYLDNAISRANAWNENYAREVMELHTLGADKGYGDRDVLELSKVLTGWTYNENLEFYFNAGWHQPGKKKVLGKIIPQGYDGGRAALLMLARHKHTANFISEKLCRYLVNDNPPQDLVRRVASVFRSTKGDLKKVYWEIIKSPEFMSRENYRAKFKTPFEFTVSSLRATGANLDNAHETCKVLERMGQPIYNCEDPTGYYDQAEAWMDSGVLTSRWEYAFRLVRGQIGGVSVSAEVFAPYQGLEPVQMRQTMVDAFLGAPVGERTQKLLDEAAGGGGAPQVMSILLGSPDFQQQ